MTQTTQNGISISLSMEHKKYVPEVEACFGDLNIPVSPNYGRNSAEELPMQVMIFLAGAITSGITYDLLKIGIKKVFQKFKNTRIAIRHEGIMFSVSKTGEVNTIVIPERQKEFVHIKTLNDLFLYLKGEDKENKWIEMTLGEVVKTNSETIKKDYLFEEILYLDTGSITKGKIGELQKIKLLKAPSRAKRLVKNFDIVYSTVRPNQEHYGFIENPKENLVVSTGFTVISTKQEKAFPKFLYYFLTQKKTTDEMQQIAEHSVSTYPSIKPENLENLEISLPPLPEQKAIASVLSSFDDKIELLREQNESLEAIGQSVFKEWFGKYQVEDKLPEGWRVGKIKDFGDIICGKTPSKSKKENFGGNIPFIKIPDMHNQIFILETIDTLSKAGENTQNNKTIPKDSICVSCIATVGLVTITTKNSQTNQQINSIIPNYENHLEYLYFSLKQMKKYLLDIGSGGTATLNVNTGTFSNIELLFPNKKILIEFSEKIKPLFKKIKNNSEQIQTLSKTRDILLPKLMRGDVRVNF